MKTLFAWALLLLFPLLANGAQGWLEVTTPTVAEAAATFDKPPREYGAIHWALGFPPPKDRILSDIERVDANGGSVYMINSGGRSPKYLSPEYFDLMKVAIDELKKRGMKMWIDGDDGYPDGLAGGRISKEYPELGMQGIVADARYSVAGGQTLDIPLPVDTLGILANQRGAAAAAGAAAQQGQVIPLPADGKLKWTGPSGSTWDVTLHQAAGEGHFSVVAGQTLYLDVPPDTRSIDASPRAAGRGGGGGGRGGARAANTPAEPSTIIPIPADGHFKWTAPGTGTWEVTFVRHVFRSSPTRYGQREDGTRDKDSLYSLIDYLNPHATATYIKLVEETYGKYFGNEFGTTILGFRGDETDYTGFDPWTPKLLETFQKQKGYDLQPYIAQFFATQLTEEARRAKADYWDVWSGMFRDNFYKVMQDWCRAHGMDYMMHLNHEETMMNRGGGEDMTKNEGSFFRDMRYMGVPGVDNLNQIGPGIVADFPKLAASAAHLFGRPQAWDEEGGNTGAGGKFIIDYQMVRGINFMNISGLNAPAAAANALQDPAGAIGRYVSRTEHLMAIGRPAAQVALYIPTDSYWMGDQDADTVTVRLTTQLMEHQVDFDHIDHDSLATVCTLENGGLKNLSGQVYRAVVIPSTTVIQKSMLERLRAFAAGGGKVVFVGRTPSMVVDQSFLHAGPAPDLSFATLEPSPQITDRVIAALPKPDVKLDADCPPIKYMHRTLKDGELYFFFNESAQTQSRTATVNGTGQVQVWDATTGTIHPLAGVAKADGSIAVPLDLGPEEARFIVIGPLPSGAASAWPTTVASKTLVALDGDWTIALGGAPTDTPLKSWQDLGSASFAGTADYRKSFDAPTSPAQGQRVYLDLGNVGGTARVSLNGKNLDVRGWGPFVWDVTDLVKSATNALEVQVQIPVVAARGGGGPPARGAAGAPGATTNPAPPGAPGAVPGAVAGAPAAGAAAARGAGARGAARGRGPGGGTGAAPATNTARGLLGPVRLFVQ